MAKGKFLLHYGEKTYSIANDDVLGDIAGDKTVGTIKLRLSDRRWLTIVTGPGIPIAIEEAPSESDQVHGSGPTTFS